MGQHLDAFLDLQHLVRAALRDSLADLELTPVQNTVLRIVSGSPGSSSAELARRTQVTAQTMHRLVADLERRGLLTLRPRPGHGRALEAHITPNGRKLLGRADVRAQAIEDRMTAGLNQSQRRALLTLLRHCVTAMHGYRLDGDA